MPIKKRIDADKRFKYACQKGKAKHRGIEFNLTYEEWWDIWEKSGKWEERGVNKGQYAMSRYGDQGAYEIGNVFIQPIGENTRQAHIGRKMPRTTEWQDKITQGLLKRFSDPNYINPNKGKSNPLAAINGKKGALKQSLKVTGRKRKYNADGSWTWQYPNKEVT